MLVAVCQQVGFGIISTYICMYKGCGCKCMCMFVYHPPIMRMYDMRGGPWKRFGHTFSLFSLVNSQIKHPGHPEVQEMISLDTMN
jgi:hypothetical protein